MPSAERNSIGSALQHGRLFVLVLVTLASGCCSSGPILSESQPNVIVFRAIAGYFPHLSEFEERLVDEGVCPTVVYPAAHAEIAERIIGARNNGRLHGPLVLVGYSAGADKALLVSRCLGERGIAVDKLVLLETSGSLRVPGNVRECLNIYKPQPWTEVFPLFRGCTVMADSPATQVLNYNVREFNDGRYDWDNHFTLTTNPYVRDLMINEVMSAVEGMPEQDEVPKGMDSRPEMRDGEEADSTTE